MALLKSENGLRTRFAPTPSGFLHIGNAWNFLLTWLIARSQGGSIHLRIDDLDAARFREAYLEDIFASLNWLGLDWDTGPADSADFHAHHRQCFRRESYRVALKLLLEKDDSSNSLVYACQCSREQVKRASQVLGRAGVYSGTCQKAGLSREMASPWQSGKGLQRSDKTTVLRLHVPLGTQVKLEDKVHGPLFLKPGEAMGDFILWQRNGEPSYQLASTLDDANLGINWVVRGSDLLPSTGAQIYLAQCLGLETFAETHFLHHGLILGSSGEKLSKSTQSDSKDDTFLLKNIRVHAGGREALFQFFGRALKLDVKVESAGDILARFNLNRQLKLNLKA